MSYSVKPRNNTNVPTVTAFGSRAKRPATYAELAALKADEDRAAAARDARFVLANHPHIGELVRNGRPVYYRNFPTYVESANPRDLI